MTKASLVSTHSNVSEFTLFRPEAIPPHVTVALEVNLEAIDHNYRLTKSILSPDCDIAGVVKADAYGLGMEAVASSLWYQGCRHFFVAFIEEGMSLRKILPKASIYVLSGVLPDTEDIFVSYQLTPVLVDPDQVQCWQKHAWKTSQILPAILHIDTGMSRNGLTVRDVKSLVQQPDVFHGLKLDYIMSHLASSEDPHTLQNDQQRQLFEDMRNLLPPAKVSLSNSSGLLLGRSYHYDLVRPGIGLLGYARPYPRSDQLKPSVKAMARVVQIHQAALGQSVGYNATHRCRRTTRLATLGVGYRDGFSWTLSDRGSVWFETYEAPVVGRVSMDFVVIDVTDIPEAFVFKGAWATLFDTCDKVEKLSKQAKSFHYELLTSLGSRYYRQYLRKKESP